MKAIRCVATIAVVCTALIAHVAHGANDFFSEGVVYDNTFRFLQSFRKTYSDRLSSWKGKDYCTWPGITCRNTSGAVLTAESAGFRYNTTGVFIELKKQDLEGGTPEVPDDVDGYYVSVISIDLAENPNLYSGFSHSWSMLDHLRHINLSHTKLSGPLPRSWGKLPNLSELSVSHTFACGGLPDWSSSKSFRLALFHADMAHFEGPLSDSFASLVTAGHLRDLNITGNNFCGCMSSTWNSSKELREAALQANKRLGFENCTTTNKCNSVCTALATPPQRTPTGVQKNWWVFLFLFIIFFILFVGLACWYFFTQRGKKNSHKSNEDGKDADTKA